MISRSRRPVQRRGCPALLGLMLLTVPAMAAAREPDCRTVRAMTNTDGRDFRGLSFGIGRNPYRMMVRGGQGAELPTPENCDLSADANSVDLDCYWPHGSYQATSATFDSLFALFQQCLGGRLTPPSGPRPYGANAVALRESLTELELPGGGETEIRLSLIESRGANDIQGYHYAILSVSHEPADPDEAEDEND